MLNIIIAIIAAIGLLVAVCLMLMRDNVSDSEFGGTMLLYAGSIIVLTIAGIKIILRFY